MQNKRTVISIALAAGLICFLVYLKALDCSFVNWEDQDYVLNNTAIRNLNQEFFIWAFTSMPLGFWLPLTWTSFAIDYHFWGLNPVGFHLTNILLHAGNTGLTVLVADGLLKRSQFGINIFSKQKYLYPGMLLLAGLLFGLHPARVESVAWVTERKDVLNGLFTLGSLLCYLRYQNKKETAGKGTGRGEYFISLVLFSLSLMAKPTSVVLPAMLLVVDWYPLGRLRKDNIMSVLIEKTPYLAIAAAITAATVISNAQQGGLNPLTEFPISLRLIVSGNSIFEYFKLMIFPVGILPYYDLPKAIPQIFIVKAIVAACFLCCCIYWGKNRPWLAATVIFFVIPLLPVLQLTANGAQLIIASRYTYLPSLVTSILVAAMIGNASQKLARSWPRFGLFTVAGLILSVLAFYTATTQRLVGVWKDSGTMWSRVIAYQPFDRAYFYRGLFYVDSGNYSAAVEDYTTCLQLAMKENMPDIYNLYAFRGEAYTKAGRFEDAVNDFTTAITMFPHKLYYYHRGSAFRGLGKIKEADQDFIKAGRAKGQMYWLPSGS